MFQMPETYASAICTLQVCWIHVDHVKRSHAEAPRAIKLNGRPALSARLDSATGSSMQHNHSVSVSNNTVATLTPGTREQITFLNRVIITVSSISMFPLVRALSILESLST